MIPGWASAQAVRAPAWNLIGSFVHCHRDRIPRLRQQRGACHPFIHDVESWPRLVENIWSLSHSVHSGRLTGRCDPIQRFLS